MISTLTIEQKQRIKNYYNRTQYNEENRRNNLIDIFSEISEVYNPINDIVSAVIGSSIKDLTVENEFLQNVVWEKNKMNELAVDICTNLYLYSEVYLEAIVNYSGEIEYIVHDFENINVDEGKNGDIYSFSVKGNLIQYDESGKRNTIPYERSYYKIQNQNSMKVVKKEKIGKEEKITPFLLDYIPVVKFKFNSTIYEALNIIDRINETDAFIRNIFTIHGDPILHADNIQKIGGNGEEETLKEARYKRKVILFTKSEKEQKATFKYIELNNAMVREMIADIERQKKSLIDLFPELILVDTTTQNVSSETFDMKNSGLKSKVVSFRKAFLAGLKQLDKTALDLLHKNENLTLDSYKFIDVFKEQEKQSRLFSIEKSLEIIEKLDLLEIEEEYQSHLDEIKKEIVLEFNALYT